MIIHLSVHNIVSIVDSTLIVSLSVHTIVFIPIIHLVIIIVIFINLIPSCLFNLLPFSMCFLPNFFSHLVLFSKIILLLLYVSICKLTLPPYHLHLLFYLFLAQMHTIVCAHTCWTRLHTLVCFHNSIWVRIVWIVQRTFFALSFLWRHCQLMP